MRILLIDDDPGVTEDLVDYLEDYAHLTRVQHYIEDEKHLQEELEDFLPEGVILDYDVSPSGIVLLGWIKTWVAQRENGSFSVVFYTKYGNSAAHREAMLAAGVTEEQIVAKIEVANDVPRLLRALEIR